MIETNDYSRPELTERDRRVLADCVLYAIGRARNVAVCGDDVSEYAYAIGVLCALGDVSVPVR